MKKHTGMQCTVLCLLLNTIATSDLLVMHTYTLERERERERSVVHKAVRSIL